MELHKDPQLGGYLLECMEYIKQTGECMWRELRELGTEAEWVDTEAGEWIELHTKQLGMRWKCWMPEVGVKGKQTQCLCNIMQIYIFYAK